MKCEGPEGRRGALKMRGAGRAPTRTSRQSTAVTHHNRAGDGGRRTERDVIRHFKYANLGETLLTPLICVLAFMVL